MPDGIAMSVSHGTSSSAGASPSGAEQSYCTPGPPVSPPDELDSLPLLLPGPLLLDPLLEPSTTPLELLVSAVADPALVVVGACVVVGPVSAELELELDSFDAAEPPSSPQASKQSMGSNVRER
jgi:hypothetical protein